MKLGIFLMENKIIPFKNLNHYLIYKYGTYDIKYNIDYFVSLVDSLLLKYKFVLKSIEDSMDIIEDNNITMDKLGNITKGEQTNTHTISSNDKHDYIGLNTNGTFDSKNKEMNNRGNVNIGNQSFNYYKALMEIQDTKSLTMWLNFEREFVKLLVTIVAIDNII